MPPTAVVGLLAVLLAAGCGAGRTVSSLPPAAPTLLPAPALVAPGCATTRPAPARTLGGVPTAMTAVPAGPFDVVVSPDRTDAFVSDAAGVTVLGLGTAEAGHAPALRTVRTVAIAGGQGLGEALTPDGRHLLVTNATSAAVLSVAALEHGGRALDGVLPGPADGDAGSIEVAVSPDGRFAFVSDEDAGTVEVYDLARALAHGFGARRVDLGGIRVGDAPVGVTLSPDGRWLFVTSEVDPVVHATTGLRPAVAPDCGAGSLSVISVAAAERDPAGAGRVVAPAGAGPVRVVLADGGALAFVTARGSDALLAFSAGRLEDAAPGTEARDALLSDTAVGAAPVGVAVVDGGAGLVVCDSNRFAGGRGPQWLTVLATPAARPWAPRPVGRVPAGAFPRQLVAVPGGATVLVTNFASAQLESLVLPPAALRPAGR